MSALAGPSGTVNRRDGVIVPLGLAAVKVYKGGAAAVAIGTGYGTPLVPTTLTHQFVGVWSETYDNSAGSNGSYVTKVVREGVFTFDSSGIVQASVGQWAYFSDDHTVTTTPGTQKAGIIVAVDGNGRVWVDICAGVYSWSFDGINNFVLSGATDAINPHVQANYIVTTAGVDAMTLAAPTANTDDAKEILISSNTANAHTLTATGLFQCGTAAVNLATFAAQKGAGLRLKAYHAKWNVLSSVGITFS